VESGGQADSIQWPKFPPYRRSVLATSDAQTAERPFIKKAIARKFTFDRGKILPRRVTGNCIQHQRGVTVAIKQARQMAMLPYNSLPTKVTED
jgi:small subunit ribosomal protein S18